MCECVKNSGIIFYSSIVLNQTIRDRVPVEHKKIIPSSSWVRPLMSLRYFSNYEGFNGWGGRGYDNFFPGEVTKTAPSGDETT